MDSPQTCPKCGAPREPQAVDCPMCGIVYARFNPDRSQIPPPPDPNATLYDPYQAPASPVADGGFKASAALADRGSRLLAQIVDGFLYAAPIVFFFLTAGLTDGGDLEEDVALGSLFFMLVVVGGVFVLNLYFLAKDGQTLGKKALKVRIVRTSDDPASLGRIFVLRMLAPGLIGAIPFIGTIFSLVDVLFIFGEERRCIHDHFADTKVVVA